MTNLQRLSIEIQGTNFTEQEKEVFLEENGLNADDQYIPSSNINKKNIYKSALSMLEALANNPQLMKDYKQDDITISQFHENLMSRIDQLERKIREIPNDDLSYQDGASFFYMFSS